MTRKRRPFQEEDEEEEKPEERRIEKGVKLENKRQPVQKQVDFEEKADEYMAFIQQRNRQMLDLVKEVIKIHKDKTLTQNKTTMARDVENSTLLKIVNLAVEINQDEQEPEGMGSIALINLLFKIMLLQRERINDLDYELVQLKKKLSSLMSSGGSNER